MSGQLFGLIVQNDNKITGLIESLKKQISAYQEGFYGNKEQPFGISEDNYDFKEKMIEFKKESQQFVNDLVDIKKNTLIILEKFPREDIWLKQENDRDWSNFIDEFIPRIRN